MNEVRCADCDIRHNKRCDIEHKYTDLISCHRFQPDPIILLLKEIIHLLKEGN